MIHATPTDTERKMIRLVLALTLAIVLIGCNTPGERQQDIQNHFNTKEIVRNPAGMSEKYIVRDSTGSVWAVDYCRWCGPNVIIDKVLLFEPNEKKDD